MATKKTSEPTSEDARIDLRKKFERTSIGLLPKLICKDCADKKVDCRQHKKQKCNDCDNWISTAHIHLDYVGHAAVTDRLLAVDPNWTWAPMAVSENGLPVGDSQGNLWINLTVLGVTRPGVGDGANMKERIGDAIRNAAMRFGVALDLWSKEELESLVDDPDAKNEKPSDSMRSAADIEADREEQERLTELADQLYDLLKSAHPAKRIRLTVESLKTVEDREKAVETLTRRATEPLEEAPIDLDDSPGEASVPIAAIDVEAEAAKQADADSEAELLALVKRELMKQFDDLGFTNGVQQKGFIHKVLSKTTVDTVDEAEQVSEAIKVEVKRLLEMAHA